LRLKEERLRAGVSIKEACRLVGISAAQMEELESGLPVPITGKWVEDLTHLYKMRPSSTSKIRLVELAYRISDYENEESSSASAVISPEETASGPALMAKQPVVVGAGIFISYRRSDQPALAGRLYDKLLGRFGEAQVFMDVDSIDLGLDFVQVLERTLAQSKALVVIIGPDWLSAKDEDGKRRIDRPDDFVRLEIETALRREDVRVIPILVEGTRMPRESELPESIKALSRRNGRDISNARFNSDCLELISTLERILRD
jgi:transcriptional regulator with XRE-family HTH domain